ncbi:surfeit locus protein 6 homolog [Salarias fasciatus]|uniref:Ribosomal RNA-processing protein 14/surfeit locus protein 6 C-terminal domain-containing protein n=1 Tax=Salarias fasciatus TaxID=181472 RepID=A0A672HZD2_SALFA|nr:surfeit locus protein 6 [Salarias fasciatus]
MDLASKDSYIQKLVSKVISQRDQEPKNRPFVPFKGKNDSGPSKKKKAKNKNSKANAADVKTSKSQQPQHKPPASPAAQKKKPAAKAGASAPASVNGAAAEKHQGGNVSGFSTVDVLRKRLHEKIEESRGQGAPKNALSEEVQAKRAKRKLERERKKRKRKEFLMKRLAEQSGQEIKSENEPEVKPKKEQAPAANKRNETAIIFNKVETVEDRYVDKTVKRKNKKQSVKGQITPLTGKNYKRLLSQVEARKTKLEELRAKDEGKALEMEKKIKWTNMLYKAEGLKIKDDEDMLRASLKRKEKFRVQRKKRWDQRSESVVEKMQQQQDRRRRNIQKQKRMKSDKRKERARKKGVVLPEDLKKAKD